MVIFAHFGSDFGMPKDFGQCHIKNFNIPKSSDVFTVWKASLSVWVPKLWSPKNIFQFFFQLYFNKKYVAVAINDFTMHMIISKWLKVQKCKEKRKTMRQRGQRERRNCQQMCFHSFTYVIDQSLEYLLFLYHR